MESSSPSSPAADRSEFLARFLEIETNLYRYVCAVAPVPQDARDIVQETALALWEHHNRYDPKRPFLPWALRVARNKARQHAEKAGRFPRLLEDEALLDLIVAEDAEDASHIADRREHLQTCLGRLKAEPLKLIEGYYWKRHSMEALAHQLRTSVEGAYKRLQRIRTQLQDCIIQQERKEARL